MPLVDVDISGHWLAIADMVLNTGNTETHAGDVSLSAGGFPVSIGIYGMALGPGRVSSSI